MKGSVERLGFFVEISKRIILNVKILNVYKYLIIRL
jgi:hypothetical protein